MGNRWRKKVKGGGKWSKGKGKANQRPKQRIWNERRKEWLLNLPVCSEPQQSVRGAPRWAINVKTRCEYLKHLPTHVGDTMERQFASGDKDLEALLRQWQPRQMRDRNWTSANYYWWRSIKGRKNATDTTSGCALSGSTRRFPSAFRSSRGIEDGTTGMEECPWH